MSWAGVSEGAFASARVRWRLTVERSRVEQTLAPLAIDDARFAARGDELILAHAAAAADPMAIAALEIHVLVGARRAIQRYTRDDGRTDEIVQLLRIHLLVPEPPAPPRLARFDGRSPLGAWVGMCATRLALHALRSERARCDTATEWSDALVAQPAADPILEALRTRHASRVAGALSDACLALPRRSRAIIRLLFVDGASVDEVAAMYQVHRVTVWRWLQEARSALSVSARARLKADALDGHATDSLVAWVEDQVELSLDGVLAPTATM